MLVCQQNKFLLIKIISFLHPLQLFRKGFGLSTSSSIIQNTNCKPYNFFHSNSSENVASTFMNMTPFGQSITAFIYKFLPSLGLQVKYSLQSRDHATIHIKINYKFPLITVKYLLCDLNSCSCV